MTVKSSCAFKVIILCLGNSFLAHIYPPLYESFRLEWSRKGRFYRTLVGSPDATENSGMLKA
jgi:hypothetical protein